LLRREFVKIAGITSVGSYLGMPFFRKPLPRRAFEEINHRTMFSKKYDLGNNQKKIISGMKPLHYRKNGNGLWTTINATLKDVGTHFTTASTQLNFKIYKDRVGFTISTEDRSSSFYGELIGINGLPAALNINPVIIGNAVVYPEIVKDVDVILVCTPYKIVDFQVLKSPNAKRDFTWKYKKIGKELIFDNNIKGADAHEIGGLRNSLRININKTLTKDGFTLRKRWNGDVLFPDKKTRVPSWRKNVERYPVTIDANITQSIGAAADDQEDDGTAFVNDSYVIKIRHNGSSSFRYGGFRFTGIPQDFGGSTVSSANFNIYIDFIKGTHNIDFYGNDVDDAGAWADPSNLPSGITKTIATTNETGTFTAGQVNTVDITTIAQELADRGDRGGTFAIAICGFSLNSSTYTGINVGHYEFQSGGRVPAEIDITYTVASGAKPVINRRRKVIR